MYTKCHVCVCVCVCVCVGGWVCVYIYAHIGILQGRVRERVYWERHSITAGSALANLLFRTNLLHRIAMRALY